MSEQLSLGNIKEIEQRILRRIWSDDLISHLYAGDHFEPCVDVFETAEGVTVKMEIAGMRKKDISVEVHGDTLIIRGRRQDKSRDQKVTYLQMEIDYGLFERHIAIDIPVRANGITAVYKDGILEIKLPRKRSSGRINAGRR